MVIVSKLYEVGAVSFVLASALGPGKQWVDALNDFRQLKADISGLRLLPVAHTGASLDRTGQPLYRLEDVETFIRGVRESLGCDKPFPARAIAYEYDATPGLEPAAWKFKRATRCAATGRRLARTVQRRCGP